MKFSSYRSTCDKRNTSYHGFSSSKSFCSHPFYPILHSFDVFLSFFCLLYIFLSISCHITHHLVNSSSPGQCSQSVGLFNSSLPPNQATMNVQPCLLRFSNFSNFSVNLTVRFSSSCPVLTRHLHLSVNVQIHIPYHFSFTVELPSTSLSLSQFLLAPTVFHDLSNLPLSILLFPNKPRHNPCKFRFRNLILQSLLILAGDVELNPGPFCTSSTLNLVHLNSRSASCITDSCDKPALIKELISDNKIDLALTETWLSSDTFLVF